jgi:nicotinate-nucleotide adenylyltransferase
MRLGIFGGTFDPVHYGHLLLAECAREQCRLDQVWFMPATVPPHKQGQPITSAEMRVEMLELAVSGNPAFLVSRHEIDRGGVNYTVDTLEELTIEDPVRELFFLMGADSLSELPTWRNAPRICQLAVPIVVRRARQQVDLGPLEALVSPERLALIRRHQVDMPLMDLSSSDLRSRAGRGESVRYRLPRGVEKYIEAHGLYRAEKPNQPGMKV